MGFNRTGIRTRHERESNATVAIFVLSYFRALVIDLISSQHNGDGRLDDPCGKRLEVMAHGSSSSALSQLNCRVAHLRSQGIY